MKPNFFKFFKGIMLPLTVFPLFSQAANILWVSDNGVEAQNTLPTEYNHNGADGVGVGAFYPATSSGTPYVDQGFVDLLLEAGHTVTRFNPRSGQLSLDDVALINEYELVILGAALNSGPFNLNAQGAKWNTLITRPMITTKSTLIRSNRMGYLKDNFEYDCAANTSTTASGKLTFIQPQHSIFKGIARTNVGGAEIMNEYSGFLPAAPLNNRGTSVQFFNLLINGGNQTAPNVNTMEPGGVMLASLEFNPLDPGVNIAAGVTPTVFGSHVATGYAIAEWPARTRVRSTQVTGGEPLGGYRLFFGCGTRDASGSTTTAPNPQAGALDLTASGQQLFLNAIQHALIQPSQPNNWNDASNDHLWNTVSANWNSPATGWVTNEDAIFGTTGAGPVTIDASVSARSMKVSAPGYSFTATNSSTLTLAGTASITAEAPFTLAAPIAGTSGLTLRGNSLLTLEANNTYTGGTFVRSGTLILHAPVIGNNASPYAVDAIETIDTGATVQFYAGAPIQPLTNNSLVRAANGQIFRNSHIIMNGGTLDLNGDDNQNQMPAPSGFGIITNSSPNARGVLKMGNPAPNSVTTFSGVIQNGNGGVMTISPVPNTAAPVTAYKQGYRVDIDLAAFDSGSVFVLANRNTYGGFTRIGGGSLKFTGQGTWGIPVNTGDPATSSPNGTIIMNGSTSELRVDLNGTSQTTGGLSGNGGVIANNRAGTCSTLTLGAANISNTVWPTGGGGQNGKIADNTTGTGGKVAVTKIGTGTIGFPTAQSTYSGPTMINDGVLEFTTTGAPSPNSPIQINNNGVTSHGVLRLSYSGTKDIPAFLVNGVKQPVGTYNSTTNPGLIEGAGSITVDADVAIEVSAVSVSIQDTDAFVTWTGCGVLQESTDLIHWTEIPGAISPLVSPITSGVKFWRLRL